MAVLVTVLQQNGENLVARFVYVLFASVVTCRLPSPTGALPRDVGTLLRFSSCAAQFITHPSLTGSFYHHFQVQGNIIA